MDVLHQKIQKNLKTIDILHVAACSAPPNSKRKLIRNYMQINKQRFSIQRWDDNQEPPNMKQNLYFEKEEPKFINRKENTYKIYYKMMLKLLQLIWSHILQDDPSIKHEIL